jgi:hypothetical protein
MLSCGQMFIMKTRLLPFLLLILFSCKENDEAPVPSITSYDRKLSGPGKELAISGSNFSIVPEENIVTFANGVKAEVRGSTPSQIKAVVPFLGTSDVTGSINVTVKGKTAIGPVFTVYVVGTVSSISPICGPIGTLVKIVGSRFETIPTDNFVLFKGDEGNGLLVRATVSEATSSQLTVSVPEGAKTGEIYLSVFGTEKLNLEPQNTTMFTISNFVLNGYSPKSAKQGTSISITGSGFSTTIANNSVMFTGLGGTRLVGNIVSASNTQIIVTVPLNAITGPISVKVNNSDTVFFNDSFSVTF